jgi:chemotaxis family two-component system response regulator PixG
MMTAPHHNANANAISIREFTAAKQVNFFETFKRSRFNGQLLLKGSKGEQWCFYCYLGRLMYATGGIHPVRRWRRNLAVYFPEIAANLSTLQTDLSKLSLENSRVCWEYQLLSLWVEQEKICGAKTAQMIRATIVEVLFEITQAMEVTCQLKQDNLLSTSLMLIDAEQAIAEAQQLWQAWQAAKIADRSPNSAPIIRQSQQLQQLTSPQVYQILKRLIDGQHTLRDLAVRMKRDVLTVTRSLLPYIQKGSIELIEVADLPVPVATPGRGGIARSLASTGPLIACVDDSPSICKTMEQILTAANYQFVGINDPLRAIALLLAQKPALIFLDLVMPNTNGYEICTQLRRLSFFRQTPIIILTGNDGIIDRVRAKMAGSSDFISKPIDPELVLRAIEKYLP